MEEAMKQVFSAGFDVRKNVRIGNMKMDYTAFRFDQQGRTLAISKKIGYPNIRFGIAIPEA